MVLLDHCWRLANKLHHQPIFIEVWCGGNDDLHNAVEGLNGE
ncbi:MAG: hypothetical protein OEM46_03625 [Ignavibacteria bacterium]|nr:hypothetical protein [Ignavibacteria bacterium]